MKQYLSLFTAAIFLSALPGTSLAQKIASIPPMLETQRPLSMPASQPEPRAPQVELAKPSPLAAKGGKTKPAPRKVCGVGKTTPADQAKISKSAKKKGATTKPRSKVATSRS